MGPALSSAIKCDIEFAQATDCIALNARVSLTALLYLNITAINISALKPTDCTDIAALGCTNNGVYTIYDEAAQRPLSVYCDMTTAHTSWTVVGLHIISLFMHNEGSTLTVINTYRSWAYFFHISLLRRVSSTIPHSVCPGYET